MKKKAPPPNPALQLLLSTIKSNVLHSKTGAFACGNLPEPRLDEGTGDHVNQGSPMRQRGGFNNEKHVVPLRRCYFADFGPLLGQRGEGSSLGVDFGAVSIAPGDIVGKLLVKVGGVGTWYDQRALGVGTLRLGVEIFAAPNVMDVARIALLKELLEENIGGVQKMLPHGDAPQLGTGGAGARKISARTHLLGCSARGPQRRPERRGLSELAHAPVPTRTSIVRS